MNEQDLAAELAQAQQEITELRQRLKSMELHSMTQGNVPSTQLLSDHFIKRAFAVWGHSFVASLIIFLPLYLLMFLLIFLVGPGW